MRCFRLVVWLDENNKRLYWKKILGYRCRYLIGQRNQYDHVLLMIIESRDIDNYSKNVIKEKFPTLKKIGNKYRK